MIYLIRADKEDVVKLNIPLLLRLLEYAEDAEDEQLHMLVENIVEVTEETKGSVLTMKNYWDIVPHKWH